MPGGQVRVVEIDKGLVINVRPEGVIADLGINKLQARERTPKAARLSRTENPISQRHKATNRVPMRKRPTRPRVVAIAVGRVEVVNAGDAAVVEDDHRRHRKTRTRARCSKRMTERTRTSRQLQQLE